jgi:23S rRNA pseudouridine2605 synthase
MRLSRYLAHSGVSSRRRAEALIRAGRVTVGGEVVTDPARDVDENSGVAFDGTPVAPVAETVVIAVNKPKGVVSTARDTHGRPTVVDLVGARRRLYPVGRLDADTTGLILLTDDGELANRLTHPRYGVPKTYRAVVAHPPVRDEALERLRAGIELDDGPTQPAEVRRLGPDTVELTIREGRKRQVRRMLEAVGHPVRRLERVRFGPLRLDLAEGEHRQLTKREVELLRARPRRRPSSPRRRRSSGS